MTKFLNISTDSTLAGNSDETVVSEKAIKAYADTKLKSGDNVSELVNDAGYLVMGDLTGFVTRTTAQTISGLKTFTADIVLSGTTSIKNTTSGVSYTMLYRDTSGIHVGTNTQALLFAGSGTRPTFNGNNVAMSADIPTVNNPTITITQGGVTKGSFTLNQASGDTIALDAGGGGSTYHPDLFDHKWADHQLNDVSWLRADTFSWQSGAVYQAAYQHLTDDIDGKTLQSETVGGTTVQFYLADDGHKVCPASEESNVAAIYTATGVAWYYIIDTVNQRFKLPRTKFGFTGLRSNVGDYVDAGLPNITGTFRNSAFSGASGQALQTSGTFYATDAGNSVYSGSGGGSANSLSTIHIDASLSSSIYGNSNTVQPSATQMYLYFYVGNFTQTALENTAGLNAELFNDKADLSLQNATAENDFVIERQEPTALNNYTWYRKYRSGWVEQGASGDLGSVKSAPTITVSFPIEMADTFYTISIANIRGDGGNYKMTQGVQTFSTTGMTFGFYSGSDGCRYYSWEVKGMAA